MALVTLTKACATLGIIAKDEHEKLGPLLTAASAAIEIWCHRTFTSQSYTEYYDGDGNDELVLYQPHVTTITSVYEDQYGRYGKGPNAFPSDSLLTEGTDYVLRYEKGGTVGESGLLIRLSGPNTGLWPLSSLYGRATLTQGRAKPCWTLGAGSIKVTYVAGYAAAAIPEDVQMACIGLLGHMFRSSPLWGRSVAGGVDYSPQMAVATLSAQPELGGVRSMLSHYRVLNLG